MFDGQMVDTVGLIDEDYIGDDDGTDLHFASDPCPG
jgi:hypothetical protein